MSDPIVLIPARLAATRLPDKPLADILGEPMIVHVWRRAVRGRHRSGGGRHRRPRHRRSRDARRRQGGADAGRPPVRLRPHLRGGRERSIRKGATTWWSTCRATCRPSTRARSRPRSCRSPTRRSTSRRSPPRSSSARRRRRTPNVVKVVGSEVAPEPPPRALLHPRHGALGRRPALSPYRPLRLSPARPGALRRPAALPARAARAAGAAARARSRHAHRRRPSSTTCRSASTRRRISSAPAPSWPPGDNHDDEDHRLPGRARRQLAHRLPRRCIRTGSPCPAPTFEDAFAAVSDGAAGLAMIPIENSIAGRVADIHHLLPASGLHIVGEHFLPIHFQLMALPGAHLGAIKHRAQPRPRARPVPQDHPQARPQGRGRGRHRRLGARGRRSRAIRPARRSRRGSPPRSTGSKILAEDVEDEAHNTTRFIILSRQAGRAAAAERPAW